MFPKQSLKHSLYECELISVTPRLLGAILSDNALSIGSSDSHGGPEVDTESRWVDFLEFEIDRWDRGAQESVHRMGVVIVSISLLVWALLESIRSLSPTEQTLSDSCYLFGIIGASGLLIMRRVFGAFQVSMGLAGKRRYLQLLPDEAMKGVLFKGAIADFVALLVFLSAIIYSERVDRFSGLTSIFLGFILVVSVTSLAIRPAGVFPSRKAAYKEMMARTSSRYKAIMRIIGYAIFLLFAVVFPAYSIYTHWEAYVTIDAIQLSLLFLAMATLLYLLFGLVAFHSVIFRVASGMNTIRLNLLFKPNTSEQQLAAMLDKAFNLEPFEEVKADDDGTKSQSPDS